MINNKFFILLYVIPLLVSCNKSATQEISSIELRSIVKKQNSELESCFKEGNAEKVAGLYTDSAKLSPNGGDFVVGRSKIKDFWANDFKSSKLIDMSTEVLTVNGNKEIIYETGKTRTKFIYKDTIYTTSVKYINVWIKQKDGKYKLDIDFWNKDKVVN